MSNKRRVAEKKLGVFFNASDMGGGGFMVPMSNLNAGPGKPGPEDEWTVPAGPVETEDDVIIQPERSDGPVALPLDPTDKR